MPKSSPIRLALVFLSLAGTVFGQETLFVGPGGNDANKGTAEEPFATIARVQSAVRERTAAGLENDIVVYLQSGTYYLDTTLRFGPLDGGTPQHSVTYAAVAGARVVLSGGRRIEGWKQADDGLWTVALPEVKRGAWFFRQLYADAARMPRGRYPNDGFLKIKSVSKDHMQIEFTEPLPGQDFGGQDTEVVVVQNWSISRELITRSNPKELTAATQIGWVGHMACLPKPGMSVFLENALALVTKPGQWYLDRKSGTLFVRPVEGKDPNRQRIVAPRLSQLVDIEGTRQRAVHNLHFKGIEFENSSLLIPEIGYGGIQACYYGTTVEEAVCFATPVAIEMEYCRDCTMSECRIQQIGGSGIGIGAGCRANRIVGCEISDVGATGINIGHMQVKDPLWADWSNPADVPVNNEIANCYIHHCGAELWGGHGIFDAMTRDSKIRHNEVAALPYGGIATGYVWGTQRTSQQGCTIEHNHVHDVMLKLNDSGCLYTLGFQPGSIIRGNLLHGVRCGGFAGGQICNNGIFFDEGSKGFLLEDNVIYDVDQRPGARNTAVRFNRSSHDWQIWINNTIQTAAEPPEAATVLSETAGLEPRYRRLLKGKN